MYSKGYEVTAHYTVGQARRQDSNTIFGVTFSLTIILDIINLGNTRKRRIEI